MIRSIASFTRREGGGWLAGDDRPAHHGRRIARHENGDLRNIVRVRKPGYFSVIVRSVARFLELLTEVVEDERSADATGAGCLALESSTCRCAAA